MILTIHDFVEFLGFQAFGREDRPFRRKDLVKATSCFEDASGLEQSWQCPQNAHLRRHLPQPRCSRE